MQNQSKQLSNRKTQKTYNFYKSNIEFHNFNEELEKLKT